MTDRTTRRSVLAAIVAGVGGLAGCGGSTDGGGDPTATTTRTATPRATTAATPTGTGTPTETPTETATPTETTTETTTERPSPSFDVPDSRRVDEPIDVQIAGMEPGAELILRARTRDLRSDVWESEATFRADDRGVLDLSEATPESGDYDGDRRMEWVTAMTTDDEGTSFVPDFRTVRGSVTLEAETERRSGTARIERTLWDPGISTRRIDADGLAGFYFEPPGSGPHLPVLALHGSGGRPLQWRGALLASHGYAVAALQYFGDPDPVPDDLIRVPLSYFDRAASWIGEREAVRDGPVGVYGVSRGGELALLLGSRFDWPGAVVGYLPSGIAWAGHARDEPTAAWEHEGEPVPFLPFSTRDAERVDGYRRWRPAFERSLSAASDRERRRATIAVENVEAPLLLVSGTDDQVWHSTTLSNVAVDRLDAAGVEFEYEHRAYEGAGHAMFPPYVPTAGRRRGSNPQWIYGGTQEGYARADPDAWQGTLSVLERGLSGDG